MVPVTSVLDFGAGVTRTDNAVVQVSTDGDGRRTVVNDSAAPVIVLLDLAGYFERARHRRRRFDRGPGARLRLSIN